jgi:hypothetical protein
MTDRIVNSIWWLALMSMICVAGAAALFGGYHGLFELVARRWISGTIFCSISLLAGISTLQLCRYRNDLL